MKSKNFFYITTPIYYVTAKPHLGSLYSTVLADIVARWNKLQGKHVFFMTGTDEHGQKIAQAAQQAHKTPQEFVDSFIPVYQDMWKKFELDYTYFARTTSPDHMHAVQQWILTLQEKGDIYKASYSGWYCIPCETFLTEKEAHELRTTGQEAPHCPSCNRTTQYVAEESYFFRLSAYQEKLLAFYRDNPDFVTPKERLQEVIRFVESGLKDLSISRTTVRWGIPFPNDPAHVVYVWADALNSYITSVGFGKKDAEKEFHTWWPADIQILGKDIVRFHAVYWPAFLMAIGLAIPKKLLVHGWIKVNDQKMSKSLGNVVDPEELYQHFGSDSIRYYLARYIAVTQDSSFSYADLEKAITSDLANDLGNLLNRTTTLAEKYESLRVPPAQRWSPAASTLRDQAYTMIQTYTQYMDDCLFHMALAEVWKFINHVNAYFHNQEPWKLAKDNRQSFQEVIAATCHGLHSIAKLLWPIMPQKMEQLLMSLGIKLDIHANKNNIESLATDAWSGSFALISIPPLFKKPETKETTVQETVILTEEKKVIQESTITFDDFSRVHLIVGTIEQCDEVPKSDKLYKLIVNFGGLGVRQILSGVRKHFTPDQLRGKQAIFVTNLQPRMMLGLESQGMMLTAKDDQGGMCLATVGQQVPNGTRLS